MTKKKRSIAKMIIGELVQTTGVIFESGMRSYKPVWSKVPREIYNERTLSKISKERLRQLERQDWLEVKYEGEQIYIKITDKGFAYGLKEIILQKKKILPRGELCLVTFDIPESMRNVRYALRELLKDAGCKMVQRSVWETRKDLVKEFRLFAKSVKADGYICVYKAKRD